MPDWEAVKKRIDAIKANIKAEGLEEGTNEYNERLANEVLLIAKEFYPPQESTAVEALREQESPVRAKVFYEYLRMSGLKEIDFTDK